MKELKIKDDIHLLPEKWSEVNLGQFQGLASINTGETPYNTHIKRFKVLCPSVKDEIIEQFNIKSFQNIIETMGFITVTPNKEQGPIEIEGVKYGIIQDLNELSVGEWADIDYFITSGGDNVFSQMHNILGVIVRPISKEYNSYGKEKYKIEEYDSKTHKDRVEYFKENMKADDALAFIGFFLRLEVEYIKNTVSSLVKEGEKKKGMEQNHIEKVGDGLDSSIV